MVAGTPDLTAIHPPHVQYLILYWSRRQKYRWPGQSESTSPAPLASLCHHVCRHPRHLPLRSKPKSTSELRPSSPSEKSIIVSVFCWTQHFLRILLLKFFKKRILSDQKFKFTADASFHTRSEACSVVVNGLHGPDESCALVTTRVCRHTSHTR